MLRKVLRRSARRRRRDDAKLAVKALMVEPVDVAQRRELDLVESPPRSPGVDQLPLVKGVETLDRGIVVAVAARTDRGDDVALREQSPNPGRIASASGQDPAQEHGMYSSVATIPIGLRCAHG